MGYPITFTCTTLILLAVACPFVEPVKKKVNISSQPSRLQDRSRSESVAFIPPALRTLDDWLALDREGLILSANGARIHAVGSPNLLAARLYQHYNPTPASTWNTSVSQSIVVSSPIPSQALSERSVTIVTSSSSTNDPIMSHHSLPPTSVAANPSSLPTAEYIRGIVREEIGEAIQSAIQPLFSDRHHLDNVIPALRQQHPLPAVPSAVLERIRRGEFINFDNLLPNNVPSEFSPTFVMSLNSSQSTINPSVILRSSNQNNKNKVVDLHTWVLAWSLFFQAAIIFNEHLTAQLAKYQLFITQLAVNYNFNAWYAYDQAFRLFLANNPNGKWDTCNEDIYNMHIRGASGRSRCYVCGGRDHFASLCPTRRQVASSSARESRSAPSSQSRFSQPFLDPQLARSASAATEFCRLFNWKSCSFPGCKRIHRCVKCNQQHPASSCPNSY